MRKENGLPFIQSNGQKRENCWTTSTSTNGKISVGEDLFVIIVFFFFLYFKMSRIDPNEIKYNRIKLSRANILNSRIE